MSRLAYVLWLLLLAAICWALLGGLAVFLWHLGHSLREVI